MMSFLIRKINALKIILVTCEPICNIFIQHDRDETFGARTTTGAKTCAKVLTSVQTTASEHKRVGVARPRFTAGHQE